MECTNTPGEGLGFKCGECPPGYMGDGIRCDDVNEVNTVSHVLDKYGSIFIGREPSTWPANNCLQIMVCSCVIPSNCVSLQPRSQGFSLGHSHLQGKIPGNEVGSVYK